MTPELRELYQEMVMDHSRRPRNFRVLADANCSAEGHNPICGDRIKVYLRIGGGRIDEVSFQGAGCAISMASASMMTEALAGRTLTETLQTFEAFQALVTGSEEPQAPVQGLGKLQALGGVRAFPVRVKCATLPWHTLRAALESKPAPVSTE